MKRTPVVFVRLNQITNVIATTQNNQAFELVVKLLPNTREDHTQLFGTRTLITDITWSFPMNNIEIEQISLTLRENTNITQDVAKLTLPLKWYKPDTVVREVYPMRGIVQQSPQIMADLDVHISANGDAPFTAQPYSLAVIPAWRTAQPITRPPGAAYANVSISPQQWSNPYEPPPPYVPAAPQIPAVPYTKNSLQMRPLIKQIKPEIKPIQNRPAGPNNRGTFLVPNAPHRPMQGNNMPQGQIPTYPPPQQYNQSPPSSPHIIAGPTMTAPTPLQNNVVNTPKVVEVNPNEQVTEYGHDPEELIRQKRKRRLETEEEDKKDEEEEFTYEYEDPSSGEEDQNQDDEQAKESEEPQQQPEYQYQVPMQYQIPVQQGQPMPQQMIYMPQQMGQQPQVVYVQAPPQQNSSNDVPQQPQVIYVQAPPQQSAQQPDQQQQPQIVYLQAPPQQQPSETKQPQVVYVQTPLQQQTQPQTNESQPQPQVVYVQPPQQQTPPPQQQQQQQQPSNDNQQPQVIILQPPPLPQAVVMQPQQQQQPQPQPQPVVYLQAPPQIPTSFGPSSSPVFFQPRPADAPNRVVKQPAPANVVKADTKINDNGAGNDLGVSVQGEEVPVSSVSGGSLANGELREVDVKNTKASNKGTNEMEQGLLEEN